MIMRGNDVNIGLITFPIGKAGVVPLSNLLAIFQKAVGGNIYLISGDKANELDIKDTRVRVQCLRHQSGENLLSRLWNYIVTQMRIAYNMLLIRRNVDCWYFYIGGELLVFPHVIGKLTRKPVVLHLPGSCVNDAKAKGSKFYPVVWFTSELNCNLANKLIVASEDMVYTFGLNKHVDKISFANEYFVDSDNFRVTKEFERRDNIVGFVGRLSEEKGILNFIQAIPQILDQNPDLIFLIGGDGPLYDYLRQYIAKNNLSTKVILTGWINHQDLAEYLNRLRLLVIPSYSEAGPIIAYEAMACGTPVLGTRVGCVLMSLEDGKTGYLLPNNSPECIAENVVRALGSPDLELVAEAGRQFVEENFTFESAVARWKEVLEEI